MPLLTNLEALSSVRTKINNLINYVLGMGGRVLDLAALLADTGFTYSAASLRSVSVGTIIQTLRGGHRYEVVASGATVFDLQTAGGVRVRLLPRDDGWFAFDGMAPFKDGTTDNLAKLNTLIANNTQDFSSGGVQDVQGPFINFSIGRYYFSNTINLKARVRFYGANSGFGRERGTRFLFPANTAGIIVNRHNTLGDQTVASGGAADNSEIVGISLVGGRGAAFNETRSGIWLRARARIENCETSYFAGHGVYIAAGFDGVPYLGNANLFRVNQIYAEYNRGSAVHIEGQDANAGTCTHVDAYYNDQWAVYEASALNNYHAAHHCVGNGLGSYRGLNRSPLYNAYSEDGAGNTASWNGPQIAPTISTQDPSASGPVLSVEVAAGVWALRNENGGFSGNRGPVQGNVGAELDTIVSGTHDNNTTPLRIGRYFNSGRDATIGWGAVGGLINFTGPGTTDYFFGRSVNVPQAVNIAELFLGIGNNARSITFGTAPPTTGARAQGDIVINRNIASGQPIGWGCSVAGTPGTWIPGPNWP